MLCLGSMFCLVIILNSKVFLIIIRDNVERILRGATILWTENEHIDWSIKIIGHSGTCIKSRLSTFTIVLCGEKEAKLNCWLFCRIKEWFLNDKISWLIALFRFNLHCICAFYVLVLLGTRNIKVERFIIIGKLSIYKIFKTKIWFLRKTFW